MDTARIRNFCIIAHIDHAEHHGRPLLQITNTGRTVICREVLDNMELERERG
jgi:translation elongation factor EF-4